MSKQTVANGSIRESTTYAITNLPCKKADAAFLLDHLRGRSHIENCGFHVLDVSLGDVTIHTGDAARAWHAIRNITLNLGRRFDQSTPTTAANPTSC